MIYFNKYITKHIINGPLNNIYQDEGRQKSLSYRKPPFFLFVSKIISHNNKCKYNNNINHNNNNKSTVQFILYLQKGQI